MHDSSKSERTIPAVFLVALFAVLFQGVRMVKDFEDAVEPGRTTPARFACPLAPEPAAPVASDSWCRRLARQDEILVAQVVAKGCDEARSHRLRELLAAREATRERLIAEREAGRISETAMLDAAHESKRAFDASVSALLTPEERGALDLVGARARVLAEEVR